MSTPSTIKKSYLLPTIVVQVFCLLMTAPLVWSILRSILYNANVRRLIHESGEVSERLIIFTLLCTPLFLFFGWTLPIRYRRTLGVYSFVALLAHVLAQLQSHGYSLKTLFEDISLTLGTIAFFIMIALAATSFDSIKLAMGRAWKRLHYGVYVVAILMEIHVIYVEYPRINPHGFIFGFLILLILAVRLPFIRNLLQSRRQRKVN